jgi:hypothetical protein
MKKLIVIILFAISLVLQCLISTVMASEPAKARVIISNFQAVESIGEINAKDNSAGTLIAGSTSELILSLIADMSQAEPGEEIFAIRILMPEGFKAKENAVNSLSIGGTNLPNFKSVIDQNVIVVSFPDKKEIRLTTIVEIGFTVTAPTVPAEGLFFIVSLLNVSQNPIIVAIKEGNADGRLNNDNLTLKVVPATKPNSPKILSVKPSPDGENDIIISWTPSDDPTVSGYLIYPSDRLDKPIDVPRRSETTYTDRSLKSGSEYSYFIRSYKTKNLVSDPSSKLSAIAPNDTKPPQPPDLKPDVELIEDGIKISWNISPSMDVVKYIIYRGVSLSSLEPIDEVKVVEGTLPYSYVDKNPPPSGSYIYAVKAIDDSGKEALSNPTQSRQSSSGQKPWPNPFTPLSKEFNQVIFPLSMLESEGGEGAFDIKIYDLEGYLVFEKEADEGSKEVKWNGKDMNDKYVASGVYVYQATMGNTYKTGTIIVAK